MKTVEVIIPTMRKVHAFSCLEKLHHIPWPYKLHVITGGKTWAEAINIGLRQCNPDNDVILMDDDVFINGDTFSSIDKHYADASIFGFKLLFPEGDIQHYGGISRDGAIGHIGYREENRSPFDKPLFTCHATTSLIYIQSTVLKIVGGMAEDIPGIQMEDVDFSFRALKAGFKILILPNDAIHLQSASKKFLPGFDSKVQIAAEEIKKRHLEDPEFRKLVESYPKKMVELSIA